jgi:hypothetical protein
MFSCTVSNQNKAYKTKAKYLFSDFASDVISKHLINGNDKAHQLLAALIDLKCFFFVFL